MTDDPKFLDAIGKLGRLGVRASDVSATLDEMNEKLNRRRQPAMTDAVEIVARAMAAATDARWDARTFSETPSGEEPDEMREGFRYQAQAALAAYHEWLEANGWVLCPRYATAEMERAGEDWRAHCSDTDSLWEEMVKARPMLRRQPAMTDDSENDYNNLRTAWDWSQAKMLTGSLAVVFLAVVLIAAAKG